MKPIFFYGLFMDLRLLQNKGLHPTLLGPAELPGFKIRIGKRASLVRQPGSTSFGMLMDLPDEEATALYSDPGVNDYRPEVVEAVLRNDRSIQSATCYNLPADQLSAGSNATYAAQLAALVLELGLPAAYAEEIANLGDA